MEDTFKLRVDKTFGSLSFSSSSGSVPVSSPAFSSSLWCLTDEEIEKKEWNRDKAHSEPESTANMVALNKSLSLDDELEEDIEELEDDENDGDATATLKESDKPDDHDDEEWKIRSSVGLDSTLDYEDEEDEYDKVAVGGEKNDDLLFMGKVKAYDEHSSNSYNELPGSFDQVVKDSRANLVAAKLRLEEEEANGSYQTQQVIKDSKVDTSIEVDDLKSIMKRMEEDKDSEVQKRVRFDTDCKDVVADSSKETCPIEEAPTSNETLMVDVVPDYIRNPSKYTCYTFDSPNDVEEDFNERALTNFLNIVKKSNPMDEEPVEAPVDLPKSLTFIPRKKAGREIILVKNETRSSQSEQDASMDSTLRKGVPVSIVVGEVEEPEVCDMDEDQPETMTENCSSISKTSGRHYRSKGRA